jgi:uncharacterized protein YggU (UPF0235/DUF167 family)
VTRPSAVIAVTVKPGARAPGIVFDSQGSIVVRVRERATEGQANEAVRASLADALEIPKSAIVLVRGARSREKLFSVGRLSLIEVQTRLRARL